MYGCFAFLPKSHVYYVGVDESRVKSERPALKERKKELKEVAEYCKFKYEIDRFPVNYFYEHFTGIVHEIEEMIKKVKPEIMLIPYRSTNQDHQTVYDACMVALRRHDKIPWVPTVLIYEDPQTFLINPMKANYFAEVNIWHKLKAYETYETQIRSYRSSDVIKNMAEFRGSQCDMFTAEGYEVFRICRERMQKESGT